MTATNDVEEIRMELSAYRGRLEAVECLTLALLVGAARLTPDLDRFIAEVVATAHQHLAPPPDEANDPDAEDRAWHARQALKGILEGLQISMLARHPARGSA